MTDTTLAKLQANLREGDELMKRVLDDLREHHDAIDELETVARLRVVSCTALASFIVESRGMYVDLATFGGTTPAYHQ